MTFASHIARSLSVRKVPTIVGIYKEKVYYFHGQISYEELKFFVKSFLPNNFVSEVILFYCGYISCSIHTLL